MRYLVTLTFRLDVPSRGKKVCTFGFYATTSRSVCLILPVVYMQRARNGMKRCESTCIQLVCKFFVGIRTGTFHDLKGIPRLLQVVLCPSCIHSPIHCLDYNVRNVWIDIECKFEFKSNALMQCTVKLDSHGRLNGRMHTQQNQWLWSDRKLSMWMQWSVSIRGLATLQLAKKRARVTKIQQWWHQQRSGRLSD